MNFLYLNQYEEISLFVFQIVLRIISGGNSIAPSEFECLNFLTEAHPSVIKVLNDFVDRTDQTGLLEYAKVFRDSFRLFTSSNKSKELS